MSDDVESLFDTLMLGGVPMTPPPAPAAPASQPSAPLAQSLAKGIASTVPQGWPARLSFDVALGIESLEDILTRHGLDDMAWAVICENPLFIREVVEHRKRLSEDGVTFKAKAKVQAEVYLQTLDELVNDATIDPKVRLEAIKSVVKWAGLEPKPAEGSGGVGNAIQVNINL